MAKKTVKKTTGNQPKGKTIKNANTNGFKQNPQHINSAGRPRKLVSHVIEEMKAAGIQPLKQSQIVDAYEMLFQKTTDELGLVANDKDLPVFVRIIAKAMLSGKGFDTINNMLDRAHGKAKTSGEVKMYVETPDEIDYTLLSDAALKEVIAATKRKQSGSGTVS